MAIAKKRATIKDVAAEAGVSYQTVSRVINNHAHVSDETRSRVQQVIQTLNFKPNLAARSLPRRHSHIIGLIIPYDPDYLIEDPNLLAQISGIDAEANYHGYSLLLSTAGHSESGLSAYERFIRNRVADGVLVIETASSRMGSELLVRHGYPYVCMGYDLGNAEAYMIHCERGSGRQVTRYLLEKGRRRIGIIDGPATGAIAGPRDRLAEYCQTLAEANIPFDPALIVQGDYTPQSGEAAALRLLSLPNPPTAIFAQNDRMALGAIRALQKVGLRVPEDIAVVGYDDIPAAATFDPPLTTVRQPSKKLGQAAAQILFKLIAGETVTPREVVLPVEFIIRQSA